LYIHQKRPLNYFQKVIMQKRPDWYITMPYDKRGERERESVGARSIRTGVAFLNAMRRRVRLR
jgi:hypothetical protein